MKTLLGAAIVCLVIAVSAAGDDLYQVTVNSPRDARILQALETQPLFPTGDGYLVLVPDDQAGALTASGLQAELVASGISHNQLALDAHRDRINAERFEVLFEDGQLRLLRIENGVTSLGDEPVALYPLLMQDVKIEYRAPSPARFPAQAATTLADLPDLIDSVSRSNLTSYVNTLQAFDSRLSGTAPNREARDWLVDKFEEFGYDSVVVDDFEGAQLWDRNPCNSYNVIACKIGSVYPEQHIIVGGHFDAVPGSPGADDNGSGTAAVLEIARVLADVETNMTIVFVAFDSEESGLHGAYHYVDRALETGEDIVLMINVDMIAHHENSDRADLYTGVEDAYAVVWDSLSNAHVSIDADMAGMAASDHWPFQQVGYDVIFVQEDIFSYVYHSPHDSTSYMDFEYMTRMVQATLATVYTVDQYPPPVSITDIREPGDGTTQEVSWRRINPTAVSRYEVSYYPIASPAAVIRVDLLPSDTAYTVTGLIEGEGYALAVRLFDTSGQTALVENPVYFEPHSRPAPPYDVAALPLKEAVSITWSHDNVELDFDHCAVMRDGQVIHETRGASYIDDDPSLGTALHDYRVVTVDTGGLICDTLSTEPSSARAATLQAGKILAVNRTQIYSVDLVDETRTGAFLRDALAGYDFDYYSDTVAITCGTHCESLELNDLLDYGVIVVGAETAIWEDLGQSPVVNGILDTLAYYLSIGGKAVVFGRFGSLGNFSVVDYAATSSPYDDAYRNFFHIETRTKTPTRWDYADPYVPADLTGATTAISTYPDLVWDSAATAAHAAAQTVAVTGVGGIPCATYVNLDSAEVDVLYTYDSRENNDRSEGKPVAWRYFGPDYAYVFFDVPLSFFDRPTAIEALRQAVDELVAGAPEPWEPIDPAGEVPDTYVLEQNYPNPFNASTVISFDLPEDCHVKLEVFNIMGQRVAVLANGPMRADDYNLLWNAGDAATGVYLYRLKAGGFVETRKMVLLK